MPSVNYQKNTALLSLSMNTDFDESLLVHKKFNINKFIKHITYNKNTNRFNTKIIDIKHTYY